MLFDSLCVEFEAAWDAMATSDLAGHTSGRCLFARHVGVCTGTLYLDVRDASEAAGLWRSMRTPASTPTGARRT